jgi:hypothetical protein
MATYSDIFIDQGSTFSSTITVIGLTNEAFDLTGYSARGQIRKSFSSLNSTDFTCAVVNPPTLGKVTISLTAEQTRALKPGRYLYDVEVFVSGNVMRIAQGIVEIDPAVTKV